SALAGAYGIAVTVTMLITSVLTYFVVRHGWGYPLPVALAATGVFVAFDALLVASCAVKFLDGGWFPLVMGTAIFVAMATWKRGRAPLSRRTTHAGQDARPRAPAGARQRRRAGARAVHRRPRPGGAAAQLANGGLRGCRHAHGAAGAVAQPETQPGAASAQLHPERRVRRGARGGGVGARHGDVARAGVLARRASLRLHGPP